jgi:hypothetical protein
MSIDELMQEAESLLVDYSTHIPLRFWLRSADAIQKQVELSGISYGEMN